MIEAGRLAVWCMVVTAALVLQAQAAALTPEQIGLLNQLSPEQREAALKAMEQQPAGSPAPQQAPTFPQLVIPQKPNGAAAPPPGNVNGPQAPATAGRDFPDEKGAALTAPPLKPFGYDLFAGVPTTFAPATDIPVPSDYIIGPGDMVEVQLFGKTNAQYSLAVTRDGTLQFPGIGPIPVTGLNFNQLRDSLNNRIANQFIGVTANVTMGPLRSIRIFVLGDVTQPGSYTVSGLSNMTNALFVSGGIRNTGSLRKIQLKRAGQIVSEMDLYDLLLRGDTRADARLQPGDVIFVPPIGPTVGVAGEVRRPAIYELKQEKSVQEALAIAGGLLATAYPEGAQLERINERRARVLIDIDLTRGAALARELRDGDVLRIYSVLEKTEEIVLVSGHVQRPGGYEWRSDMRLTDLIRSADDLLPRPDLDYVLIRRELPPDRRVEVFSANLRAAYAAPHTAVDPELQPRDQVIFFSAGEARGNAVAGLIAELQSQASKEMPASIVTVGGRVRFPGSYPLEQNMRVSDLIRAGGQLSEAAYALQAELTSYEVFSGEARVTAHVPIDLAALVRGDPGADRVLQPHDQLTIKELPQWREQEYVEITGEVRFPGRYPITRGETLSQVIVRAGGLTDFAYPEGSVFMREELRQKEQERFDQMAQRLREQVTALAAQNLQTDPEQQRSLGVLQQLITQLEHTRAAGRLVIDLPAVIVARAGADVIMKDGDRLTVPPRMQEVTVIGEVFHQTSHFYLANASVEDYLNQSGGVTRNADGSNVYVIRANGAVVPSGNTGWFRKTAGKRVLPGDTIVVPMNIERIRPLTLWTSISQIAYQLGIAVAAWNTVGIL